MNYDEWGQAICTALRAKRKRGFVDGSITKPDDAAPELEDWWTIQSMIISWIMNIIKPKVRSTVNYKETVKDL